MVHKEDKYIIQEAAIAITKLVNVLRYKRKKENE